jgi:hypothetical protein
MRIYTPNYDIYKELAKTIPSALGFGQTWFIMLGMPPKYYGAAAQYNKPPSLKGRGGMDVKKIGLIVGLILVIITILVVGLSLVSSVTKGPQEEFVALAARSSNFATLLDKQKSNIKNGDLKKINAEATTLMLSDSVELSGLATRLFGVAEIPATASAAQGFAAAQESLDKAKISGIFDRTYVTEITSALDGLYGQAKKVRDALTTKSSQGTVDRMMTDIIFVNDQLTKVQL